MRRALLLTALALVVPATASAKTVTQTAQSGSIVATIHWDTNGKFGSSKDITMTVFDGDTQLVDASVPNNSFYTPLPEKFYANKAVGVQDFDGDGTPEVVFDFFTGGAHCCVLSYLYDGSTLVKHDWGDPGYDLQDDNGDGVPEFNTNDVNFDSLFASHAGSILPAQVLQYRDGAFADFTRDPSVRPRLLKDRKTFAGYYKTAVKKVRKGNTFYGEIIRSSLAAITANECLLGDCAPGFAKVDKAVSAKLTTKSFKRQLTRLLTKLGYEAGD